jgi:hypothetical protein
MCSLVISSIAILIMDMGEAINELVAKGQDLLNRLRSPEGRTVTDMDLHILRVQLQLLDSEVVYMQHMRGRKTGSEDPQV